MDALVGMGVALVTPFKSDLSVDHEALAKVVEFNIENGTSRSIGRSKLPILTNFPI